MPVKFDDISKVATEVCNDDYQTSGYQLKAKQKASYGGCVLSTQVDLFPGKDPKAVATPSKLTWKWPNPFGFKQASIDKLEVDKAGKFKLEASSIEVHPGLKLECKSDLADLNKVTAGFTYTGIQNAQVKFETKAINPADFTAEATFTKDIATVGLKMDSKILKGGTPDLGVRVFSGPFFCSFFAKDKFQAYNAHLFYKANQDLKCAAMYTHGGKENGNFTFGVDYKGKGKVKVNQDQTVSLSLKHSVSKGFTLLGGVAYGLKKGNASCGLQLSIE